MGNGTPEIAPKMTEEESAELDEMVGGDPTPEIQEVKPTAPEAAPEPRPTRNDAPAASACEFCGASPKVPTSGFDCMCMRRQTPAGLAASKAYKEAAAKAVAEKAAKK